MTDLDQEPWTYLESWHWRLEDNGWTLDFWPTTGAWAFYRSHERCKKQNVVRSHPVDAGVRALRNAPPADTVEAFRFSAGQGEILFVEIDYYADEDLIDWDDR